MPLLSSLIVIVSDAQFQTKRQKGHGNASETDTLGLFWVITFLTLLCKFENYLQMSLNGK